MNALPTLKFNAPGDNWKLKPARNISAMLLGALLLPACTSGETAAREIVDVASTQPPAAAAPVVPTAESQMPPAAAAPNKRKKPGFKEICDLEGNEVECTADLAATYTLLRDGRPLDTYQARPGEEFDLNLGQYTEMDCATLTVERSAAVTGETVALLDTCKR